MFFKRRVSCAASDFRSTSKKNFHGYYFPWAKTGLPIIIFFGKRLDSIRMPIVRTPPRLAEPNVRDFKTLKDTGVLVIRELSLSRFISP